MSIPDRFYRIAKHKLGEVKDWFDKVDEEEEDDARQKRQANPREDARRELSDTLAPNGNPPGGANLPRPASGSAVPVNPPRTPQDYARGGRPAGSGYGTGASGSGGPPGAGNNFSTNSQPDPLDYHYKLLGLEAGADFPAVQAAYNKLAARSDPSRFPAGSSDALAAQQIRQRLDTSFKTLREALDTTAARFNLLEFDEEPRRTEDEIKEDKRRKTEDNKRRIE